jgi:TolB-like protein
LPCSAEAVRAALGTAVGSRHFAKAYRCTMLLSYLVERALECGDAPAPPEQEIGIAVFGRDRQSYFPADDPIVRVQAGRLRLRLAAYYAEEGAGDALRISVPLGRYQACVALAEALPLPPPGATALPAAVLMFCPLQCVGADASAFTAGLSGELEHRLYRDLPGFRMIGPGAPHDGAGRQRASHVLEGSVRREPARFRLSLQLRHGGDGSLLWCGQFDNGGDVSIAAQEQLAGQCVQALLGQLQGGWTVSPRNAAGGNGNDTDGAAPASIW